MNLLKDIGLTHSPSGGCIVKWLLVLLVSGGVRIGFGETSEESGINAAPSKVVASKRDPFWPVGYMPEHLRAAEQDRAKQDKEIDQGDNNWNQAGKLVVMNGVSSRANNEVYAVINNEIKAVGDTITVSFQGRTYSWAVDSIAPSGKVKLRRLSVK